jgi:hypothetical protein
MPDSRFFLGRNQEFTSVHTPLDLARCKDATPAEMKEYGTTPSLRRQAKLRAA